MNLKDIKNLYKKGLNIMQLFRKIESRPRNNNLKFYLEELYQIAKDRPQSTAEIHSPNDFYGNATILKQYAKIPQQYQIKASIEHAPFWGNFVWDVDINAPLPAIICNARHRYKVLKKKTNKALFSIGPMILYASHYLDEQTLNRERQRLGKNLLVFAGHSTHWIDCNYDIAKFCRVIERIGKEFNKIRICLYWKDILRGHAEQYLKHGFECVTAGHIFDPLFLPRLKSIIELATYTASNIRGTHSGYCILMGKPHYYYEDRIQHTHTAQCPEIIKRHVSEINQEILETFRVFSNILNDITPQQKEIVEKYWGLSEIKSQEEMQEIFEITEDMYKKGPSFFMSDKRIMIEQALDYLSSQNYKKALTLFVQSLKVYPEIPELLNGKAIALSHLERTKKSDT